MAKKYNLLDVDDSYKPIPAGVYKLRVEKAELRQTGQDSKNPGADMITVEFKVDNGEYEGKSVWTNFVFTENSLPIVKRQLRALDFSDNDFAEIDVELLPSQLEGRKCNGVIAVGVNPKTDDPNNSIKKLTSLSDTESALP